MLVSSASEDVEVNIGHSHAVLHDHMLVSSVGEDVEVNIVHSPAALHGQIHW
jgi:hypothetical protein